MLLHHMLAGAIQMFIRKLCAMTRFTQHAVSRACGCGMKARGKRENRARHCWWAEGSRERGSASRGVRAPRGAHVTEAAASSSRGTRTLSGSCGDSFRGSGWRGRVGGREGQWRWGTSGAARTRGEVRRLPSGRTSKGRGPCCQGIPGRNKQCAVLNSRAGIS